MDGNFTEEISHTGAHRCTLVVSIFGLVFKNMYLTTFLLSFAFLSALHHKFDQNAIKQCLIYNVCVTFANCKLTKWI